MRLSAADFEVVNTLPSGFGSLNQAILDANDNPGADRVVFNIPGSGVRTIRPPTAGLPAITEALEIDGFSQPGARPNRLASGFDGTLLIQIEAVGAGTAATGLVLAGDGFSVVRGLIITRCSTGIYINSPSNVVAGNFIGVGPDGLTALGNGTGISTGRASGSRVGGAGPPDRNVIISGGGNVIYVGATQTNLMIVGNYLGTDATGLAPLPRNATSSTLSVHGSYGLVLGGLDPGEGNVIATGFYGLHLYDVEGARILGNYIGVGADGQTSIRSTNGAIGINAVSGTRLEGNTIACCSVGVSVEGTGVAIVGNRIHSNGSYGISESSSQPINDPGDGDVGPNELQNYPTMAATLLEDGVAIVGDLSSKPDTAYHLEFFAANEPATNGLVQGEYFLGSRELTTAADGRVPFTLTLPTPSRDLDWVTATATDPAGNTSVFYGGAQARSETFVHFHAHPTGAAVSEGTNITLRAEVSGAAPLTFQWRLNGTDVPGATNVSLALTNVQVVQRGSYQLVARNAFGSAESRPAELTMLVAPVFEYQPAGQVVVPGQWVTVSVGLREFTTPPISFRWRSNGLIMTNIVGARTDSYYSYRAGTSTVLVSVLVTNPVTRGAVTSSIATNVVAADRDRDGLPDVYESQFGLDPDDPSDATGDPDEDGIVTGSEYLAGTDPWNGSSRLEWLSAEVANGIPRLEFLARSNRTYRVEYRDDLDPGEVAAGASWRTLTGLPARRTNGPAILFDRPPGPTNSIGSTPSRFYRLSTPYLP